MAGKAEPKSFVTRRATAVFAAAGILTNDIDVSIA
jgi:hypothetical protein